MNATKTYNFIKKNIMISMWLILFLGVSVILNGQTVFGGEVGEYAKIRPSPDVESQIKSNRLRADYKYYYTGRADLPYAVIGIDSGYTMKSDYWVEIKSLDQVVYKMKHLMPIVQATDVTYGKILDADGNQAGIWVSEYSWGIVRFEGNNTLTVFSPYQPNDDV